MAYYCCCLDLAMSFGFFPQCPFQQIYDMIKFKMRNLLVGTFSECMKGAFKEPFDHAVLYSRIGSSQSFVLFNYNFSGQTGWLGWRCAHCQQHADSTVLLQIQTGSLGNPPTSRA
jgi:hypothetical protein